MTEKRYYFKDFEEAYYVFDSKTLSESEFEDKVEYYGYNVFADSLTGEEVVDLLNENERLQHKLSQQEMEYATDLHRLAEEKEQLKSQVKQLQHWNKCLAEKRHQELPYHNYEDKEIKDFLKHNILNCNDR